MRHQVKYFLNLIVPDETELGESASVPAGESAGEAAVNKHTQVSRKIWIRILTMRIKDREDIGYLLMLIFGRIMFF